MSQTSHIATGRVVATRHPDNTVTFAWEGDDIVAITRDLLRGADPRYITFPFFPDAPGSRFTIGPYTLETLGVVEERDGILAKRVYV